MVTYADLSKITIIVCMYKKINFIVTVTLKWSPTIFLGIMSTRKKETASFVTLNNN